MKQNLVLDLERILVLCSIEILTCTVELRWLEVAGDIKYYTKRIEELDQIKDSISTIMNESLKGDMNNIEKLFNVSDASMVLDASA